MCRNILVNRTITALLGVLTMAGTVAGVAVLIVTIEFQIKFAIHIMVSAPIVDTFEGTCRGLPIPYYRFFRQKNIYIHFCEHTYITTI